MGKKPLTISETSHLPRTVGEVLQSGSKKEKEKLRKLILENSDPFGLSKKKKRKNECK